MEVEPTLLKQCIANDCRAQLELYKRCYPTLLSVCLRYESNKEDAEFLLNNGFMKILTHLSSYTSEKPFEAWIRRIMLNAIIDNFRKYSKHKNVLDFKDIATDGTENHWVNYNSADLQYEAEELLAMVRSLPTESRRVFNLYAIDGYSHKEIGEKLGISDGTSKWHLSFARKKLREMLAKSRAAASAAGL
ncbi:MAG: RNA polymerase sigma factor [Flavobacteriales bacterium]|jgi:RNA polymerase sigma-70 factor (ECF subfamily)|nr:RNA polymerase sigma factor [Flavobacteriales bacterium]